MACDYVCDESASSPRYEQTAGALTSISTVLRFSHTSSGGACCRGGRPAASSSFLIRRAVFVRARWSLSSSRSRVKTS